jgi:hypothetical protein
MGRGNGRATNVRESNHNKVFGGKPSLILKEFWIWLLSVYLKLRHSAY